MSEEKTFIFNRALTGIDPPEVVFKKESELTAPEKDLLLGQLIRDWEHNTDENRDRFLKKYKFVHDPGNPRFNTPSQGEKVTPSIIEKHFDLICHNQNSKMAMLLMFYWIKSR